MKLLTILVTLAVVTVANSVAADVLVACEFLVPFSRWVASAAPAATCPLPGQFSKCAQDSDCTGIPASCMYGGTSGLSCINNLGAMVCGFTVHALPNLVTPGGFCNSTASTCALCQTGGCINTAMCVQQSLCSKAQWQCYPQGHSIASQ
jgi:hypothetical protein